MNKLELEKRLKDKINNAREYQLKASQDAHTDYYYWEGYIAALDYIDDLIILLED
jgi:hypothetical protein